MQLVQAIGPNSRIQGIGYSDLLALLLSLAFIINPAPMLHSVKKLNNSTSQPLCAIEMAVALMKSTDKQAKNNDSDFDIWVTPCTIPKKFENIFEV